MTMPNISITSVVITVLLLTLSCTTPVPTPNCHGGEHRPWTYLQAKNQTIKIEERETRSLTYHLVSANPSAISKPDFAPTFADVIYSRVKGQTIQLWVATQYAGSIYPQVLPLIGEPDRKYRVEYLNPDGTTVLLQTIEMKR